jgi:hypothetical protein
VPGAGCYLGWFLSTSVLGSIGVARRPWAGRSFLKAPPPPPPADLIAKQGVTGHTTGLPSPGTQLTVAGQTRVAPVEIVLVDRTI